MSSASLPSDGAVSSRPLYLVVLVMATAGLGYELALGTADSFLLGDPIVHMALLVGLYMASLGLGALASGLVDRALEQRFVDGVLLTSWWGGVSAPVLFGVFALQGPFRAVLYALTVIIGALVGFQLPVLMRLLRRHERFADVVGRAFAFDYLGGLAGSVGFTLLLMPAVGLVRATPLMGLLNALAAAYALDKLGIQKGRAVRLVALALLVASLAALVVAAPHIEMLTER